MAASTGSASGLYAIRTALISFLQLQSWTIVPDTDYIGADRIWASSEDNDTVVAEAAFYPAADSMWRTDYNQEVNAWIAWSYATPIELTQIRLKNPHHVNEQDRMIRDFRIQYSDDALVWNTADTYTGETAWGQGEIRLFSVTAVGVHAYWRIISDANDGDPTYLHIGAIFTYDSGGLRHEWPQGNIVMQAPLSDRGPAMLAHITLWNDPVNQYHTFRVAGSPAYQTLVGDPGNSETYNYVEMVGGSNFYNAPLLAAGNSIPYWFVADGYRFIAAFNVNARNYAVHAGYYLPYGSPNQYPFAVAVGGSMVSPENSDNPIGDDDHIFLNPGLGCLGVYMPDSTWLEFDNVHGSTVEAERCTWPYEFDNSISPGQIELNQITNAWSDAVDKQFTPLPVILNCKAPYVEVLGEFDGLYQITGYFNAAGNTFTIGVDNYVVFQDGFRTEIEDYWALKLA